MSKKIKLNVGIVSNGNADYIKFLNTYWDVVLVDLKSNDVNPDLILFTGGSDVDPSLYYEKVGKHTHINKERDALELEMFNRYSNVPKLGICRGSQFLTVASGGKLIQHVEGHATGKPHLITVNSDNLGMHDYKYQMTSTHHQMMYPYNLNKEDYNLIGTSTFFLSPTYMDGKNEFIDVPRDFLEPEIVYYRHTKSLAIQGHPEFFNSNPETADMCLELINAYLIN